MLHILLLLLKIIGGFILVVLCLFLLILALVLLVPVRYRVSASRYTFIEAEGHVSWLCHLIQFFVKMDTEAESEQRMHVRLKIACFCVYDNLSPKKERIKKESVRKNKKQAENSERQETAVVQVESSDRQETEMPQTTAKKSEAKKNGTFFRRIFALPSKISSKIHAMAEKLEAVCEKKDKLMAIYHDEKNHLWLTVFAGRLKRLMIGLLPGIDRIFWHFGFNDPASTGKVLGMLSILYPLCEDRMVLQPEFDRQIMEGEIRLHGHVQLLTLAVFAIRSFLNKQFFSIIRQIKHI